MSEQESMFTISGENGERMTFTKSQEKLRQSISFPVGQNEGNFTFTFERSSEEDYVFLNGEMQGISISARIDQTNTGPVVTLQDQFANWYDNIPIEELVSIELPEGHSVHVDDENIVYSGGGIEITLGHTIDSEKFEKTLVGISQGNIRPLVTASVRSKNF